MPQNLSTTSSLPAITSRICGCLLGTALGDAVGLPYEGLSAKRARRLLGSPTRHRLFFGRGMVSDDTEQSCMVAQALIASGSDPEIFQRKLARSLRWWLVGLPAGVGLATLRSILKMWAGISPARSGVFSAGNGPAMRSAILGAAIDDLDLLRRMVRANTLLTHTDPSAEEGAFAVALAAWMARQSEPVDRQRYLALLVERLSPDSKLLSLVEQAIVSVGEAEPTTAFAAALGLERGVTGYVLHTVPVAVHAWLSNPADLRIAVQSVIDCGGDTDTTAAIVGGIVGAGVGRDALPADWLDRLWEWPRTVGWMDRLGRILAESIIEAGSSPPPALPIIGLMLRNILFLSIVLFHGFRRLLPPY